MKKNNQLFYPVLQRRDEYSLKKNGEFYQYQHYRQEIREDCQKRCVYCDIQESECGGEELMVLEHFRPQKHFANLINNPNNLLYACSGCNRLKSDHWPNLNGHPRITFSSIGEGFLDPFSFDRNEYFHVLEDGVLEDIKAPAKYMIRLLALNRETRKIIREIRVEKEKLLLILDKTIEDFQIFLTENSFTDGQTKFLNNHLQILFSLQEKFRKCLLLE
ncbi:MAG: hypothetical protein ABIL11_16295 [Chloroflexota bacterium]